MHILIDISIFTCLFYHCFKVEIIIITLLVIVLSYLGNEGR